VLRFALADAGPVCLSVPAAAEFEATADLYLSPEARLLADAPGISDFVYDGCGHKVPTCPPAFQVRSLSSSEGVAVDHWCWSVRLQVVLPEGVSPDECLPLVLVGAGKTLRLRNATIVHASSLPACLQLGPGAQGRARASRK
jgi:hypothetical protein